jgi:hypothetical protein
MIRIRRFSLWLLYASLSMAACAPAAADEASDRKELVGSFWVIPDNFDILTIFEVKPDGSVIAGRGGVFGMEKEVRWIGSYRNKELILRNKRFIEEGGAASETMVARIDGSKMTGRYNLVVPVLGTNDKSDFTGYCANCFGYVPAIGVITLGGLIAGGTILRRRARKRKGPEQPGEKKVGAPEKPEEPEQTVPGNGDDEEGSDEDEPEESGYAGGKLGGIVPVTATGIHRGKGKRRKKKKPKETCGELQLKYSLLCEQLGSLRPQKTDAEAQLDKDRDRFPALSAEAATRHKMVQDAITTWMKARFWRTWASPTMGATGTAVTTIGWAHTTGEAAIVFGRFSGWFGLLTFTFAMMPTKDIDSAIAELEQGHALIDQILDEEVKKLVQSRANHQRELEQINTQIKNARNELSSLEAKMRAIPDCEVVRCPHLD